MILIALLIACGNECSFYESCDGDTLLVCGSGPDQSFGRTVHEIPCTSPNEVCVPVGDSNAGCAASADTCEGTASSCDGDVLTECAPFESTLGLYGDGSDVSLTTSTDCAAIEETCIVDDATGAAGCG